MPAESHLFLITRLVLILVARAIVCLDVDNLSPKMRDTTDRPKERTSSPASTSAQSTSRKRNRTFGHLAAVHDLDFLVRLVVLRRGVLDRSDGSTSADDPAEDDMLVVEMRRGDGGDEAVLEVRTSLVA
jgi:hypothetical protein